jgi:hypothetical protein
MHEGSFSLSNASFAARAATKSMDHSQRRIDMARMSAPRPIRSM